jgi:hypothetical protein
MQVFILTQLKKVEQEIEIRQQRIAELMDRIQTINAAMKGLPVYLHGPSYLGSISSTFYVHLLRS